MLTLYNIELLFVQVWSFNIAVNGVTAHVLMAEVTVLKLTVFREMIFIILVSGHLERANKQKQWEKWHFILYLRVR